MLVDIELDLVHVLVVLQVHDEPGAFLHELLPIIFPSRYFHHGYVSIIAIALRADLTTTSCAQTGPVRDEHETLVIGWTSAKPTVLVDLGISA